MLSVRLEGKSREKGQENLSNKLKLYLQFNQWTKELSDADHCFSFINISDKFIFI